MIILLIVIIPLLASLILPWIRSAQSVKIAALITSLLILVFVVIGICCYRSGQFSMLSVDVPWIPGLGIRFHLAADAISLLMVLLTCLLMPFILLCGFGHDQRNTAAYYSLMILMQAAMIGVFTAVNAVVFYIFWELALIPAYFILLKWGDKDRVISTTRFFLYTLAGSLLMLFAFIYLYTISPGRSFELSDFVAARPDESVQKWLFWCLFAAFAIKIPLFPFHGWQPATYASAPLQGVMLLSGIMLKMGLYGIIRYLLPVVPDGAEYWSVLIICLSLAGMIYAAIIALKQTDLRRVLAYSSVAHMGLAGAALFSFNIYALQGVIVQSFAHGVNIIGLFFLVDVLEKRLGTRDIRRMGGLKTRGRLFAIILMIFVMGNIALPLTNGFAAEFLMCVGIFVFEKWFIVPAILSMLLGAVYQLYVYQKLVFGMEGEIVIGFSDIGRKELMMIIPLIILIFIVGIFPGILTGFAEFDLNGLLELMK